MPAAGCRHYATGELNAIGDCGWCWSASAKRAGGVGSGCLRAETDAVYPQGDYGRAHGFPVRCVQHLRLLPFSAGTKKPA